MEDIRNILESLGVYELRKLSRRLGLPPRDYNRAELIEQIVKYKDNPPPRKSMAGRPPKESFYCKKNLELSDIEQINSIVLELESLKQRIYEDAEKNYKTLEKIIDFLLRLK